jgi:L-arabinose isomerase
MKIRKPWVSRVRIRQLEEDISNLVNEIEGDFIELGYELEDYNVKTLSSTRLYLNGCFREIERLAYEHQKCFWFNPQLHPDYESVREKIEILRADIGDQLKMRKSDRYKDSR